MFRNLSGERGRLRRLMVHSAVFHSPDGLSSGEYHSPQANCTPADEFMYSYVRRASNDETDKAAGFSKSGQMSASVPSNENCRCPGFHSCWTPSFSRIFSRKPCPSGGSLRGSDLGEVSFHNSSA